jgi:hypothetical protein
MLIVISHGRISISQRAYIRGSGVVYVDAARRLVKPYSTHTKNPSD